MKRKVLVFLFFLVVFGLPVIWYLFLQLFGENKFDLPKLQKWDQTCVAVDQASVVLDPDLLESSPNLYRRINAKLEGQDIIQKLEYSSDECATDFAFYLVDEEGWVRGQFELTREEVDRLMAEIDIYLLNKRNEHDAQPDIENTGTRSPTGLIKIEWQTAYVARLISATLNKRNESINKLQ